MRAASADLIYGATKTRKTTMLAELAEYVFEKYGERTRVVHADIGGTAVLDPLIEVGIVDLLPLNGLDHPLEVLDKLCQGYWPVKRGTPMREWVKDFTGIGAYGFEGLTSFSDMLNNHFKNLAAMGKLRLSQDTSYNYVDGETKYAGGNQVFIGEIQNRMNDLVCKTSMIPVRYKLWTAHESAKAGLDNTKAPAYGPMIIGNAKTSICGAWFGNFLHLEQLVVEKGIDPVTKQGKLETRPVMYLKPHADPGTKIPFHAGTRATPEVAKDLPEYLDPPSIRKLYEVLEAGKLKNIERLRAKFPEQLAVAVK